MWYKRNTIIFQGKPKNVVNVCTHIIFWVKTKVNYSLSRLFQSVPLLISNYIYINQLCLEVSPKINITKHALTIPRCSWVVTCFFDDALKIHDLSFLGAFGFSFN